MCGLYGIINNGPKRFRKDIFTALGILNDRRGGDSCGVYIDGNVEYGIGQNALFENFFWDCNLLNNTETCEIALGHDRKASVGGVTVEKAHPIIIKNETGSVDFVLVHNGTIHNYESLAEKFIPDIDCKNLSDSQVLALILYHTGFDVLDKYNGGTAFVAVDYRKGYPQTYLYKGASKEYSTSLKATVERPLYFSINDEGIIFSSIASILCGLMDNNVYEAKDNKVYKYEDGKLYIVKTANRDNCQQIKSYSSYYNNYSSTRNVTNVFKFAKYIDATNLYCDDESKPLNGKHRVTIYGRLLESGVKPAYTSKVYIVFFFNGIPFKDKLTYNIVNKKYKKSRLTIDEFVKRNITFIRYWAVDNVFFDDGKVYVATSETSYMPYTGLLHILFKSLSKHYKNGVFDRITYDQSHETPFVKYGFIEQK